MGAHAGLLADLNVSATDRDFEWSYTPNSLICATPAPGTKPTSPPFNRRLDETTTKTSTNRADLAAAIRAQKTAATTTIPAGAACAICGDDGDWVEDLCAHQWYAYACPRGHAHLLRAANVSTDARSATALLMRSAEHCWGL